MVLATLVALVFIVCVGDDSGLNKIVCDGPTTAGLLSNVYVNRVTLPEVDVTPLPNIPWLAGCP